ncbi:MAG TPA: CCA tRNA nucleotidyltransferase, partial [Vicinamibacteria bacterium]|nr:CCA tRNA nucleotidyltransferase [Vicinamibacteria bacterium]
MEATPGNVAPRILARAQHVISRKNIDPDALKVLYRLKNHGFVAYLVGGGVRDLLLERRPKDFDIGTSAHPQQIKKLFRNCFIIGRRFRLCHVRFGRKVVEVSTFRRQAQPEEGDTLIRRDNTFGPPEEDAFRRDFTVNALFYDIATFSVIDWVGGLEDLQRKVIRTIGDPAVRFREDPVRMLR